MALLQLVTKIFTAEKANNADNLSALFTTRNPTQSNPSPSQSTPEQNKQDDDRQWHSNQPQ
jgi:hypothetical protein